MIWKDLWMTVFGRTNWLGLNMGFWVSLMVVVLIVIIMNVFFWSLKPQKPCTEKDPTSQNKALIPTITDSLHS